MNAPVLAQSQPRSRPSPQLDGFQGQGRKELKAEVLAIIPFGKGNSVSSFPFWGDLTSVIQCGIGPKGCVTFKESEQT